MDAPDGAGDRPFPQDPLEVGRLLRERLEEYCGTDEDPWIVEHVGRAWRRLSGVSPASAAPVILYLGEPWAFTGPGEYVYVTRGFAHLAWQEEWLALALAHELAHRELGHTRLLTERFASLRYLPGSMMASVVAALLSKLAYGVEREAEADARGLELCLAAGYEGARCIELFDRLEQYALDHGDHDIVFGPAGTLRPAAGGWSRTAAAGAEWLWKRRRGYPCLQDRKEALRRRLAAIEATPTTGSIEKNVTGGPVAAAPAELLQKLRGMRAPQA